MKEAIERAANGLPKNTLLVKTKTLWLATFNTKPYPLHVWQHEGENFTTFIARANNEIRARKV